MSYQNTISTLTSGYDASASFTTQMVWPNHDSGSVHVVWTGLNATDGTIRCRGSNDGSNWDNLTTSPSTMTAAAGNVLFNFKGGSVGYSYVQVYYAAASNSAGSITILANRKSLR